MQNVRREAAWDRRNGVRLRDGPVVPRLHVCPSTMMLAGTAEVMASDEVLAAQARDGANGAFATLVARHQDRIYRLAVRMSRTSSDAEDVVQDTFLRAHRGIASFHGDSRFGTWLYRIAMNEALMHRRYAKRRPVESLEALLPRFADLGAEGAVPLERADDMVDRKALAERVRDALEHLDESHRAAFVLRDLEGLRAEEAAEVLGVSSEAVRQRAHRARLKLRTLLADLRV